MLYKWREIINIPHKPGVYAWYFSPEISDYDLNKAIEKLKECKDNDSEEPARIVNNFFNKHIFSYFEEDAYKATLSGPMKPRYQGELQYVPNISVELVKRIIDNPERLHTVKSILKESAPYFSSPLYIGMSDKLGNRLIQHKRLIEKYKEELALDEINHSKRLRDRDQSFALEICRRKISCNHLFVVVNVIDDGLKGYVDIENILNRIHYPLLGKN